MFEVYCVGKIALLNKLKNNSLQNWLIDFLASETLRANSLIITVYGDAIAPHGGVVGLTSLIKLMEPFGLNSRVVRTSVFRLAKEDWLSAEQVGRKSFYGLTKSGLRRIEHATHRIYDEPKSNWQGDWHLVLLADSELNKKQRELLRSELQWQGFGLIAPGVLARPDTDVKTLKEILADTKAADKIVSLKARSLKAESQRPLLNLVHQCWNLEAVEHHYQYFLYYFTPLLRLLKKPSSREARDHFLARTLLIHEYRRVMLRDPQLPPQLLPKNWHGGQAHELAKNIYRLTRTGSEQYLQDVLEAKRGKLPKAAPYLYKRFGIGVTP
jgi:phenylacetic acid degradation operon negative regulatory protein